MFQFKRIVLIHALLLVLVPCIGGCALILEYPITTVSLGIWGTTGKSPTDHAVSYAIDEDCQTLRAINAEPICKKNNAPLVEVVDKSFTLTKPEMLGSKTGKGLKFNNPQKISNKN